MCGALDELTRIATRWHATPAPGVLLLSVGHAERAGTGDYNQRLSERREIEVR